MSFRKIGGLNHSSNNHIVRNEYSSSTKLNTQEMGVNDIFVRDKILMNSRYNDIKQKISTNKATFVDVSVNNLHVSNNLEVNNHVSILDVNINNNLDISNNLEVKNHATFSDVSVNNNLDISNNLEVKNHARFLDVSINNNLYVKNDLDISNNLEVKNHATFLDVSVNNNLYVKNDLDISNNVEVKNHATFLDVSVNNNLDISNNLEVKTHARFLDVSVNNNLDISNNLEVKNHARFLDVSINNNLNVSENIYAKYINTNTIEATKLQTKSDYRLKTNVENLDDTFNVDNLRPVIYDMNSLREIGLIAHEIQEIYPFLVSGIKDGIEMQSVNYIGLIGILIKELQKCKFSIQHLQNEVNEMKKQMHN